MSDGNVLRVGLLTEVDRIDPRKPPEFVSSSVLNQVFESPYSRPLEDRPSEPLLFDGPLEPEPGGGPSVLSAAVRGDVVFSDGSPLTAADVARSLTASRALAGTARVEARGERVVFTLERPNARFHLVLTQASCGVFREEGGKLLGTGPFVPAPDSTPTAVHLVRNERHRERVAIDEVRYRLYPQGADGRPSELLDDLEEGRCDLCYVLGREDVSRLTKVRKHILPGGSTAFLYFNTERPALAQVELRRAIAHALDRAALARACFTNALAFTAQSPLPPVMASGRDGLQHDPKRAAELLARPGVMRPERLTLLRVWGPRPYLPQPGQVTAGVVDTLGRLGIAVDVVTARNPEDYFERIARGDADLFLSGWTADTPDPADFLESVLSSRAIPRPGHLSAHGNLSRWSSPAMDAAVAAYRAEPGVERWQEVLRLLALEVPLVPLLYGAVIFVHSWRVRGFEPSPFGWVSLGGLELRT